MPKYSKLRAAVHRDEKAQLESVISRCAGYSEPASPSFIVSATTHGVITIAINTTPARKSCMPDPPEKYQRNSLVNSSGYRRNFPGASHRNSNRLKIHAPPRAAIAAASAHKKHGFKREEAARQQGGLFIWENSSNGGKAIRTFWLHTKFGPNRCQGQNFTNATYCK
jgi:hypothetical protein